MAQYVCTLCNGFVVFLGVKTDCVCARLFLFSVRIDAAMYCTLRKLSCFSSYALALLNGSQPRLLPIEIVCCVKNGNNEETKYSTRMKLKKIKDSDRRTKKKESNESCRL